METYEVLSQPRESQKTNGLQFFYYSGPKTAGGKDPLCLCYPGAVERGIRFHQSCLQFNEELKQTFFGEYSGVQSDDFLLQEPEDDDALDTPARWSVDPDQPATPRPRPRVESREAHTEAVRTGSSLKPDLLELTKEVNQVFHVCVAFQRAVPEMQRFNIAQKLTATILIPYYKDRGISLDKEDVQAMTF